MKKAITALIIFLLTMSQLVSCAGSSSAASSQTSSSIVSQVVSNQPVSSQASSSVVSQDVSFTSVLSQVSSSSSSQAISSTSVSSTSFTSIYAAYDNKYTELVAKYGKANIKDYDFKQGKGSCSYLTGVCIADLIDFNGDGKKDLFVIYSNGNHLEKNIGDVPTPQAGSYEVEIWTYTGGELKQLLDEPHVGSFLASTYDWNEENCTATVYEKDTGLPVIQLCGENSTSISYENLYFSQGKIVTDTLTYSNKSFTLNGSIISEAVWCKNVDAYKAILLSTVLSSPDFASSELTAYLGIDYNLVLAQTERVANALSHSQPAEFQAVEGKYISLYLNKMDQTNRACLDSSNMLTPYHYGIYDIDGNGTPELIFLIGTCEADNKYTVYTTVNDALRKCGDFSGFNCSVYINGKSGLVHYMGHMGVYEVDKITISNMSLKMKKITEGNTSGGYPALEKLGLGDYNKILPLCNALTPYLLYSYSVSKN